MWLSLHFGDLAFANQWYSERAVPLLDRLHHSTDKTFEALNHLVYPLGMSWVATTIGRPDLAQPLFSNSGLAWDNIDAWVDDVAEVNPNMQKRGEK